MKVAVTGGAGYIGSHAVRELRDSGHDVVVLDDLSAGHRSAVPSDVTLVEGDLGDRAALGRFLEGAEAVIHFAGLLSVGQSVSAPGRYYQWNVVKGLALLDAMHAFGVKRLVFSSTCAVYGVPVRVPIDETHPKDPINPYGASKLAFERILLDHARAGQLRAIALRYFNAAGCHEDGSLGESHDPEEHLVPLAIDAALGRRPALTILGDDYPTPDGTCIRDYIHVQDLARAHVLALESVVRGDGEPFDVFNLGSGTGYSVKQVIEEVGRVAGKPVPATVGPRRAGDPPQLVAAPAKAREKLGFATTRNLGAIVETAYRWRREHAL
jgi:UDP-glucose-4-epimerase GalE